MASITVALELDSRGYITSIQNVINQTTHLTQNLQTAGQAGQTSFDKIADHADMAIGRIKALAAAFIGLAAIKSAYELADQLDDLSAATGVSIEKIIQLQSALQVAGGNAEDAGRLISTLQNHLDQAAQGSSDAQDKLFRLGFSLKEITNLSPDAALQKTIEKLAAMTNPTERNALAFELLGKSARNIDWNEIASGTQTVTDAQRAQADAAREAARIFDEFERNARAMKLALMESLGPLNEMIKFFDKLAGGGAGDFALKAFKVTFETVAILATNVGYVVSTIVSDIQALYQASGAALAGDFAQAGAIMGRRKKEAEEARAALDEAEKRIMGLGPKPEATAANKVATGGNRPAAPLGLASELEGIRKLADAYAYANEKQREKIQRDYDLIHSSEETKKITEEVARIQTTAQDEILKLEEKRKTLTPKQQRAGEGRVIDETIAKIREQSKVDTLAATVMIDNNEARKRSMDELLKFYERQEKFGEIQVGLNDRLKESQFQGTLIGKGELSKQYLQITENARQLTLTLGRLIAAQYTEEDLQNPEKAQEFADRLVAISDGISKITDQQVKNLENSREWNAGWKEAFNNFAANAGDAAKQAKGYFETFTKGVEDAIVRFVKTGKLSFKDLANSLIEQFVRIQVQQGLTTLGGSLGMGTPGSVGVGSLISSGFSALGSFLGFKASGGPVAAGQPYIVGERGPELFIPQTAGNIASNSAMAGSGLGTTVVNYSISAVDASSFRSLIARDPSFIYAVTEQGRRSQPSRRLAA